MPFFKKNLYLLVKDASDRILAFFLLILCLPALLLIAICLVGKGKIFFLQVRIGYKGRMFWIYKFSTMRLEYDTEGTLLPDALRLTRVGKFLRKTSLDELPQLWNILKGDMSFVGPRPLLPEYLNLYNDRQATRHNVRQGLTGWAQIHGRNELHWQTRLELDAEYALNASFLLDLYIIWKTIIQLIMKKNGDILIEKFKGNVD